MFNSKESADDRDLRELYRMRGEIDRQIREIESRKKKQRKWLDDLRESIRKQFAAVDLSGLKKGGDMTDPNEVSVALRNTEISEEEVDGLLLKAEEMIATGVKPEDPKHRIKARARKDGA